MAQKSPSQTNVPDTGIEFNIYRYGNLGGFLVSVFLVWLSSVFSIGTDDFLQKRLKEAPIEFIAARVIFCFVVALLCTFFILLFNVIYVKVLKIYKPQKSIYVIFFTNLIVLFIIGTILIIIKYLI